MTSTTTSTWVRVPGSYVVAATDNITFDLTAADRAYYLYSGGGTPTLTILGTVHVDFSGSAPLGAFAIQQATTDPAAFLRIGAGGALVVDASPTTGVTGFFNSGEIALPFENDGYFSVTGGAFTTGVSFQPGPTNAYPGGGSGSFVNTGTFKVSSGGSAYGNTNGVVGVDLVSWSNSGTITVSADDNFNAPAFGLNLAHMSGSFSGSTVTNTGTLSVTGGASSAAIWLNSRGPFAVTIVNSGTISGPSAIAGSTAVAVDLTNTGTINGDIHVTSLGSAGTSPLDQASHIHNSGAIHGGVYFAGGDGGLYDGRGGTLTGGVHLGTGSATVLLGDDGETVYGAQTYPAGQEHLATVTGGLGNDTYVASSGVSVFDGGGGVNTVSYAQILDGVTVSLGLLGTAQNIGGAGTVTLTHVQNLTGSYGSDTLTGDASDNVIDPGPGIGNDVLDGGPGGEDTVSFASSLSAVVFSLRWQGGGQNWGSSGVTLVLNHFQDVIGSAHDDTIGGDGGDNRLDGGGGVDTVSYATAVGGVTVSLARQGAYQDTGADGRDLLSNFQNLVGSHYSDHLTGDAGDNVIDGGGFLSGSPSGVPHDVLDGGGGTNTLSFGSTWSDSKTGVTFSLARQGQAQDTGPAGVVTASNFQNLIGSAYDDHLTGDDGDNVIDGGGGNDVLDGGGGINTLSYASATMPVAVSLALQGHALAVYAGKVDTVTNFQNLTGSVFSTGDILEGDSGDNVLDGAGGLPYPTVNSQDKDTVSYAHATAGVTVSLGLQGQAQDTVGAGKDTLLHFQALAGSAFADRLEGGGATPTALTGGLGADTFVYRPADGYVIITDFSGAQGDVIDLSHVVGLNSLSRVLAYASQDGADTLITAGGGSLRLQGVSMTSLTASDFVLSAGPSVGPGGGGTPTTGSGTLNGGSGSDWLQGQAGNDTLHGGAGSDYLDGGAGLNTATYDGVFRQYVVSSDNATVTGGPEGGSDDLANIQRIQFADGYLATSPTDTAGQVYRVYEATLGRAPDQVGLSNWVHSLNGGMSLQTVVNGFVGSQEFQALYGSLDNTAFVNLLYANVLHRPPDADGLSNWVATLNSGHSRAEVVLGFSESQEDIAALAAPVQQGLWIEDAAAAQAARLYDTVFGRLPDVQGLANWTHALESGTTLQTAAAGFVASQEFQTVYGALDNTAFLTLLYHNVLHRDPDASGLANWQATLAKGTSRAEVVMDFSESQEHVANLAPHIDYGVWVAG